jgi:hypothetical protein
MTKYPVRSAKLKMPIAAVGRALSKSSGPSAILVSMSSLSSPGCSPRLSGLLIGHAPRGAARIASGQDSLRGREHIVAGNPCRD